MTVKEVIEMLSKLDNKEMMMVIDCPHCGHSEELHRIEEVVVIGAKEKR